MPAALVDRPYRWVIVEERPGIQRRRAACNRAGFVSMRRGVRLLSESRSRRVQYKLPGAALLHYLLAVHNGRFDGVKPYECGFNLSDFNPVAANLHLKVLAPHVDQAAIGTHHTQIACE